VTLETEVNELTIGAVFVDSFSPSRGPFSAGPLEPNFLFSVSHDLEFMGG